MLAKLRILLLAAALVPGVACACLWVDGVTLEGQHVTIGGFSGAKMLREVMNETPGEKLAAMERSRRRINGENIDDEEMTAVTAILKHDYADGIHQLEQMEVETPGRYSVASNLGTVYELSGDNQKALQWISEGLRRNPDSHFGTEWLHKLILETKIKIAQDPQWLQTHRVLELDESRLGEAGYVFHAEGRKLSKEDLGKALQYQLSERLVFVKPTDPVVADLLYSYGLITAQTQIVENAKELMAMSREYGFAVPSLIDRQMALYDRAVLIAGFRFFGMCALGGMLFAFVMGYGYKKKWYFLSSRDYKAYKAQQALNKNGPASS